MGRRKLVHGVLRLHVASALRKQGYSVRDARDLSDGLTDEMISTASEGTPLESMMADGADPVPPAPAPTPGSHPFLDFILNFLNSPTGQMLIQTLIKLLLGGLGA